MTQAATSPAPKASNEDKIQQQYLELLNGFQSIQLSTVSAEGEPTASYSPAVMDDERNFYIFVSEIAHHTGNMMKTGKAAIMIIEDEGTAAQIFARKRVSFRASVSEVERGSEHWESILGRFEEKFGRVVEHLKAMDDFHLMRLAPEEGRLVVGFGRAYSISADLSEVVHLKGLDGNGHRDGK